MNETYHSTHEHVVRTLVRYLNELASCSSGHLVSRLITVLESVQMIKKNERQLERNGSYLLGYEALVSVLYGLSITLYTTIHYD